MNEHEREDTHTVSDVLYGLMMVFVLVLLLFSTLIAPILAVIVLQNAQRRRHTRALARTFGLQVKLDPTSRFSRARPSARGIVDGCEVVIETAVGSSSLAVQGNHYRADLGQVSVSVPRRRDDVFLRISPGKASASGGDQTITLEFSSGEDTDRTAWLTAEVRAHLADHQRRFDKRFAVAWLAKGRLTSITSPLFTKRRAEMTEDRVRLLLHLSHAIRASEGERTT